jgi:uncharacterized protein (TIGR00369 family)
MQQHIANGPEDLLPRDRLLAMSGLEFMQAMLAGSVAHPTISGGMNYHLHCVEDGRVAFRGTPEFTHTNPFGAVHGGWYGTLLDSALGCAVMTRVPRGRWYTTLEYKVNLTRAIPLGTEIEAVAAVRHAGRTTAVAEGEIRGVDDGKLYATGSTTCLIMAG